MSRLPFVPESTATPDLARALADAGADNISMKSGSIVLTSMGPQEIVRELDLKSTKIVHIDSVQCEKQQDNRFRYTFPTPAEGIKIIRILHFQLFYFPSKASNVSFTIEKGNTKHVLSVPPHGHPELGGINEQNIPTLLSNVLQSAGVSCRAVEVNQQRAIGFLSQEHFEISCSSSVVWNLLGFPPDAKAERIPGDDPNRPWLVAASKPPKKYSTISYAFILTV